jgi:small subunit ribosomal protein S17
MEKKKTKGKRETAKSPSMKAKAIAARGRIFKGEVIRKFPKRITIQLERTIYIPKYERFLKKNSVLHARLPDEFQDKVEIGDIVRIQECRPLSKIIHFIFIEKVSKEEQK